MEDLEDNETPQYEPLTLERLVLPSGGWVSFVDPDDLTGADIKRLVKALDAEGRGTAENNLYDTALVLLVDAWEVDYAPGLQPPRYAARNKAAGNQNPADKLKARDYRALVDHIKPVLRELTRGQNNGEDDDAPR
jgi:hypothetical protein